MRNKARRRRVLQDSSKNGTVGIAKANSARRVVLDWHIWRYVVWFWTCDQELKI